MGSIRCQEFEDNYDTPNYVDWIRSRVSGKKKEEEEFQLNYVFCH